MSRPLPIPPRWAEVGLRVAMAVAVVTFFGHGFAGDIGVYWREARGIGVHHLPYRDFAWEFPPLTVVALLLLPLAHNDLGSFGVAVAAVMIGVEYLTLELVRRAFPDRSVAITWWWTALCVPLCSIAYFRLDLLAVLPATAFVVGLSTNRRTRGMLVLGFAAKLWPAVLLTLCAARREWRRTAVDVCAIAGVVAAWWAFSPGGFAAFLHFRRGDGVQIESLVGAVVHLGNRRLGWASGAYVVGGHGWHWVDPVGALCVGAVAAVIVVAGRRRAAALDLELAAAGLVTLLVLSSRLFSPQYLVWSAPFVVMVAARRRCPLGVTLFAASVALTLTEMVAYVPLVRGNTLVAAVVVVRNMLLLGAAVAFLAELLGARSAPGPESAAVPDPAEFAGEELVGAR